MKCNDCQNFFMKINHNKDGYETEVKCLAEKNLYAENCPNFEPNLWYKFKQKIGAKCL